MRMRKSSLPNHLLEASRNLRRTATPAEEILWEQLRGRKLAGEKFRRQEAVSGYIADILSIRSRLIIELDGAVHDTDEMQYRDAERQAYLESLGWHFLRFRNSQIEQHLPEVLNTIKANLKP